MGKGPYFAYLLASRYKGTLYCGVTNDIIRRIWEHKEAKIPGFTKRYGVTLLVHLEVFETIGDAIGREKRIKEWPRQWKVNLIEETNPRWRDLYEEICHNTQW